MEKMDMERKLNFEPFIYRVDVIALLEKVRQAKIDHKKSSQCEKPRCTACHFWSGSITALSELLGQPGVID